MNNQTLISPVWDSVLRSVIISAGSIAVATGKATPDQVSLVGTNLLGLFGAVAAFGSGIWGVTHKLANQQP